jgi:hypothetical protein
VSQKWVSRLAWGIGALGSATHFIWLGIDLANWESGQSFLLLVEEMAWYPVLAAFPLLAALILSNQPRNMVGWLLMIPGLGSALLAPAEIYLNEFSTSPPSDSLPVLLMIWLSNWAWVLLIFPLLLIALVFPTGRPPSPRWRPAIPVAIGLSVLFILFTSFSESLSMGEDQNWALGNPIGFISNEAFEVIIIPWLLGSVLLTLTCIISLIVRFRRAGALEREQIKWLLYACGLFAAVFLSGNYFSNLRGLAYDIWAVMFPLSVLAFPVSIAIAITRYRLWDIDVIIRRTLIYGTLTASLALLYAGSVVILQQIFQTLTGSANQSQLAIVISTLAVAALFNPLRRRVQERIDRRFYRQKYDAERILMTFAETARQQTDLDALNRQLVEAVQSSLQPEQVSLWLKVTGEGKKS